MRRLTGGDPREIQFALDDLDRRIHRVEYDDGHLEVPVSAARAPHSGSRVYFSESGPSIEFVTPNGRYSFVSPETVGPVTSVNGDTGAVVLDYTDVGAAASGHTHTLYESLMVQIEGTANEEIQYVVPFDMTITGWTMLLDVSGSMAVDVWHDTYANHPPTDADSIVTPSVTSAAKNQATGLSLSVNRGDVLIFHVDSVTTATLATVALTGTRTV